MRWCAIRCGNIRLPAELLSWAVDASERFRFKNPMNRAGDPSVEVLLARIAALEAENRQLTDRVVKLEDELALAGLHRFAPRSEKHVDRLFNEAEQATDEDDAGNATNAIAELPDTGLPSVESGSGKKRGRRPLPANLPRERVE